MRLTVSRQTAVNRQKSFLFYRQPSKMQIKINHQNVSWYFKSHYFRGFSRDSGS